MSRVAAPRSRCKIDGAVARLGLEPRTVRRLAAAGGIPGAAKIGGTWTFDVAMLDAFVSEKERETCQNGLKHQRAVTGGRVPSGGWIQAGGRDHRWSLRTDDPKVASKRRKTERDRIVAAHHYGDQRRTLSEAAEAWGRSIASQLGKKTYTRYLSSLAVLQPHLEGLYLDEIDKKLIGAIVESWHNTPYIPKGKKHPIIVKASNH